MNKIKFLISPFYRFIVKKCSYLVYKQMKNTDTIFSNFSLRIFSKIEWKLQKILWSKEKK